MERSLKGQEVQDMQQEVDETRRGNQDLRVPSAIIIKSSNGKKLDKVSALLKKELEPSVFTLFTRRGQKDITIEGKAIEMLAEAYLSTDKVNGKLIDNLPSNKAEERQYKSPFIRYLGQEKGLSSYLSAKPQPESPYRAPQDDIKLSKKRVLVVVKPKNNYSVNHMPEVQIKRTEI